MIQAAYIHIPFCQELCHYCDFNKVYAKNQPIDLYLEMLEKEIEMTLQNTRPAFQTIYIGGGTPTVLSSAQMKKLLSIVNKHMRVTDGVEFTIEGNPNDITPELVALLREFGVNRISLGAQTFQPEHLKQMNRTHSPEQIERAISYLFTGGMNNINVDLIYGYPEHTLADWQDTLKRVVQFPIQHISAYSLIIEPKTKFYLMEQRNQLNLPDEDIAAEMYEEAMRFLPANGLNRYELSNYATEGYESRHNLVYWNNEEYYGFGAGAHSYTGVKRIQNYGPVLHYIRALKNNLLPILNEVYLTKKERVEEEMFLGLRKATGVSKKHFEMKFGFPIEALYQEEIEKVKKSGLLAEENGQIFLTERGCLLGNIVFEQFLLDEKNDKKNQVFSVDKANDIW